jgi:hypothetical protein
MIPAAVRADVTLTHRLTGQGTRDAEGRTSMPTTTTTYRKCAIGMLDSAEIHTTGQPGELHRVAVRLPHGAVVARGDTITIATGTTGDLGGTYIVLHTTWTMIDIRVACVRNTSP